MKNKRKKMRWRAALCLLGCVLLFCGCADDRMPAGEGNAAVISGADADGLREIADRLSQMQTRLDEIDAQYQKLQERIEQSAQQSENRSDTLESGSQELPPQTPQTTLYTYQSTADGIVLTKYLGAERKVVIPGAIDGMRVVGLADSAFAGTAVRSVVIPETVKTLGWFTFYGCAQLEQVTIPASVESIGYASFDGCSGTLILSVSENSYAQKYAASFALRYITQ